MFQLRSAALPVSDGAGHALARNELYILPTRHGAFYALVLAVLLLAAINYENGLAYGLTFLLAAIAVVSMLHVHRTLLRLRLAAGPCPPVHVGELARFTALLTNDGRGARLGIATYLEKQEVARVDLPAHTTRAIELAVPTARRGYLDGPELVVTTCFPLGLWYSWSRRLRLQSRCLVYPCPAPPGPPPQGVGIEYGTRREGEDFAGLRPFHAGDAPQHVAWKIVARGQDWYTKQFGSDPVTTMWLDWDAVPGRDVETRLSVLCRWVLDAQARDLTYGLRLPGTTVAPATGAMHEHECLRQLALYPG